MGLAKGWVVVFEGGKGGLQAGDGGAGGGGLAKGWVVLEERGGGGSQKQAAVM